MSLHRRDFLIYSGLGAVSSALLSVAGCSNKLMATNTTVTEDEAGSENDWEKVRAQFNLDPNYIHMAGLLLTSHPTPVQYAYLLCSPTSANAGWRHPGDTPWLSLSCKCCRRICVAVWNWVMVSNCIRCVPNLAIYNPEIW
ncbi:hypothetical protein [Chlorogloeopsis fritschii]|uniref:hypothetical protein n=1 Tax=Chlorogloeopsis fritschii TaxID=1124 RepID=UPI0023F28C70|nr:hypothetical protein [Chlorogloeopsis fritschii]